MVWYLISVYIINKTLRGRLEIRNFSSRVEKVFHSFAVLTRKKRNFVSPSGHVISSIYGEKFFFSEAYKYERDLKTKQRTSL